MGRTFVIKICYGGLGDHLFYSHLPRIAKNCGWDRVAISTRSAFRHDSYRSLIWEANPFVDDYTDEDAPFPEFSAPIPDGNLLDTIMLQRGLDDGRRWHEPELFYQPKPRTDVQNAALYDPNYVSYVGDVSVKKIASILGACSHPLHQLKAFERSYPIHGAGCSEITTSSLQDYCDLIASCRHFYCLTSGGATLAAALAKASTAFFGFGQMKMFHHSSHHLYVDVSREWFLSPLQIKHRLKTFMTAHSSR